MKRAVLLMAYGSPETPDEVEPYFTHIRAGRKPSPEAVEHLRRRYDSVGGRTPLLELTGRVREALARQLGANVYIGMKHWHPFIGDVVPRIAEDGVEELTALAMAPHYSRISIGGYQRALDEAVSRLDRPLRVRMVEQWHMNPLYLSFMASRVRESFEQWPASQRSQIVTVFSAHSLPARIRKWQDPYEAQLLESCRAVATQAGVDHWRFAWQSAGATDEPWLEPDIVEVIEELHAGGTRHVLSVPIGFVSDHLEILYDIDREARGAAERRGMTLHRTRMPNDDPAFIRALASVVNEAA